MAFRARVAVAVAITVLLAGCSGDDAEEPPPSTSTSALDAGRDMRARLTDDGCAYEGDHTPATGTFTIEVENQTEYFGAFAVARLAKGSAIADLETFLDQAEQQFQETGSLPDPPSFYKQLVRSGVEPGASGLLPVDVPAGAYALMCFVDDLPTWRAYAAARLDVTG